MASAIKIIKTCSIRCGHPALLNETLIQIYRYVMLLQRRRRTTLVLIFVIPHLRIQNRIRLCTKAVFYKESLFMKVTPSSLKLHCYENFAMKTLLLSDP